MVEWLINDDISNCYVLIYRNWCPTEKQEILFNECIKECTERTPVTVYGKTVLQPRNSKVYGDEDIKGQKYANHVIAANPWNPHFEEVKYAVSTSFFTPNSCLVNGYVLETDNVGFHRDSEMNDSCQVVCTLSLGASRRFIYRRYDDHNIKINTILHSGDLLYMWGNTNKVFEHSIPPLLKEEKKRGYTRYSLTFRHIKSYDP